MQNHLQSNYKTKCTKITSELEQTWLELSKSYLYLDNYDKAMSVSAKVLKYNPNNADAYFVMCQLALTKNDNNKVFEFISKIAKLKGEDQKYHLLCGHYFLRNNIERSYKHFTKVLEQGCNTNKSYLMYGIALFKDMIGDYEGAKSIYIQYYNKFNFYSYHIDILFRLGVIYKKQEKYRYAGRIFNILLQMKRLNVISRNDLYTQIAHLKELQGKDKEAFGIVESILKDDKEHVFANRLFAWLRYKKKENVNDFKDPYCYYLRGRLYFEKNKTDDAIKILNNALELEDSDPWIWNSLGIVHYKRKEYEKAKENFLLAYTLDKANNIYEKNLMASCHRIENNTLNGSVETRSIAKNEKLDVRDIVPDIAKSAFFDTHLIFGGKVFIKNILKMKIFEFKV